MGFPNGTVIQNGQISFKILGYEEQKCMSREIELLMINHHLGDLENQDLLESC